MLKSRSDDEFDPYLDTPPEPWFDERGVHECDLFVDDRRATRRELFAAGIEASGPPEANDGSRGHKS